MKIELVVPAAEDSARLKSLAMATLAGLTPPDIEISFLDDTVRCLDPQRDLSFEVDLAALSVTSKTAARAYELAQAYRQHGVKVVLGGIHPTALFEEALEHADAVVIGEAEGLWEKVLDDLSHGRLQRTYRHGQLPDFQRAPRLRRDIFTGHHYVPLHMVQVSRGCPFTCEFCSVAPFYGNRFRRREIRDVVEEIERLDSRWIMFADDNILCRSAYSRRLFVALTALHLRWFGQATVSGLEQTENLRLLAASGCKGLFIGFESVSSRALRRCGKMQNDPAHYLEIVRRLQDHDIGVWASFIFGLDDDDETVFERTLEFASKARVNVALFALLTPYPGTPLYQRLKAEGRLLEDKWWLRPRHDDFPLFRPRLMSAEQLYLGWQQTWKDFYSGTSILRRFPHAPLASWFSFLSFLPLNLHQRWLTERKILGGSKFFWRDRKRFLQHKP